MRGDIVGARGKVKLADASGIFISLGDLQESGLFLERDSGKGAAEEGKLDLLRLKGSERCQPSFDSFRHVGRCDIARARGDFLLVAKDAVIGTAPMRNEDRNDGMGFHESQTLLVFSITDLFTLICLLS